MNEDRLIVRRGTVDISVTDRGGNGSLLVLLHGLAGSARELFPTADALTDAFHVVLIGDKGWAGIPPTQRAVPASPAHFQ